jgi:cell wall-associated NlpC family hydrolase
MTNDVKDLSKELAELESAIAEPDLAPTDQVKLRERHAFVALRLAEIEAAAPYADTSTEDLQAQAETGELEREDARLAWESAKASRGEQSVLARQTKAAYDALKERDANLRAEFGTRAMQQTNAELAIHRAHVHAERELRAEDEAAVAGLENWRREKATEALRGSFDDRLAQRVGPTKERLISEAEAKIGTRLIFGPSGPDGDVPVARPVSELLAEVENRG